LSSVFQLNTTFTGASIRTRNINGNGAAADFAEVLAKNSVSCLSTM
jgi:hypothetical protein